MSKITSINLIDTAKLIRQSLKEAFPDVKFSVRSERYANGSSIHVAWGDGPGTEMVESIAKRFEGSYFDAHTDYPGNLYHRLDGAPVHFGPDHVFCHRQFTDAAVMRAIDAIYEANRNLLEAQGVARPVAEGFRLGDLSGVYLGPAPKPVPMHEMFSEVVEPRSQSMFEAISAWLHTRNDRVTPADSPTANRVTISAADNDKAALPEKRVH